jgi:hypothetical protein
MSGNLLALTPKRRVRRPTCVTARLPAAGHGNRSLTGYAPSVVGTRYLLNAS